MFTVFFLYVFLNSPIARTDQTPHPEEYTVMLAYIVFFQADEIFVVLAACFLKCID